MTDAKGNTTWYNYEFTDTGLVVTVTNALSQKATTKYDLHGRVAYSIDFGGTQTDYEYDSYDRVKKVTVNGEVTEYSYDGKGNITKVVDPSGTIKYDYYGNGFLSAVTNAKGNKISYEYNDGYQLSKISIDNKDISYAYDEQGRLTSVTDSKGTTKYAYDENGNRKSTTYPNGLITTYEYNNLNLLVKQVTKNKNGTVIASFEYEIGKNGERTKVTELGRTVEYEYDELNRLVKEKVTRGTDVSETTYTYDANSNRLSMKKDGKVTTYAYNALNQITRAGDINYTWDNAGNLASQTTTTGALVASYTYDSLNRMISANVSTNAASVVETYEYDYLGNRTAKTSSGVRTEYTTDLSTGYSQVLKATTGSDTVYYTRGFELISRQEGSAASYYIYDGGLSVRALTNEAGTVTDTLVFDAFGNETVKTGSSDNSYGFQGEEKDETGLYYLRARYMDPSTGTFTSMDTYGGSLSDSESLHKYLFANANPIKFADPSGHMSKEQELGVVSIITILANAVAPIISIALSILNSAVTKFIVTAIVAILIGYIISRYIAGVSTTAGEVGDIIVNDSIPKEVLDAIRQRMDLAQKKAITISTTLGLRKGRSQKEWHHIVAKRSLRFNEAHQSRVILSKSDYVNTAKLDNAEVDHPDNLAYIKTSLHRRLHCREYHAYVLASLKAVFNPADSSKDNHERVSDVLKMIRDQLELLGETFPDVMVI